MAKRPAVEQGIIQMNPEALSIEYAEQVTDALGQNGIALDEIQRSTEITAHFIGVAVNLLKQDPGFQTQDDPNNPTVKAQYLSFQLEHCTKVLELFTYAIIKASLKSNELDITGDAKSSILQTLAQDAFFYAKQLTAATVGQEDTPDMQLQPEQLREWMDNMVVGALHHYLAEYQKTHGPIGGVNIDNPLAFNKKKKDEPVEQPVTQQATLPTLQTVPHQVEAAPNQIKQDEAPTPIIASEAIAPEPEEGIPPIYFKLGALGLFLSTQATPVQQEWMDRFPPEYQEAIRHYMVIENVANELPMEPVIDALDSLNHDIIKKAKAADAVQSRTKRHLIQLISHPTNQALLEPLIASEGAHIKQLFRVAPRANESDAYRHYIPTFPPAVEHDMLTYFETLLANV
jgi:hypothetical protein